MATDQGLAKAAWPVLVAYARSHRTLTYGNLVSHIGGAPLGMGRVLNLVRKEVLSRDLPMLSCIAIRAGGMPGDGWYPYVDFYRAQTMEERERLWIEKKRQVFTFLGWDSVLIDLGIAPELARDHELPVPKAYGKGGDESEDHKALKEHVRQDPKLLGLGNAIYATSEFPLPSGDEVDVYIEVASSPKFHVVEVKVDDPAEMRRGIYQSIKYRVLAAALKNLDLGSSEVVAHLVTAVDLPPVEVLLANKYGILTHKVKCSESLQPARDSDLA